MAKLSTARQVRRQYAYKVLKPINVKNAIKKFADRLKSQKRSTIIASTNFASLKDSIRAAQDEDTV